MRIKVLKDRKSNRLHRNIPSARGPVKAQREPLLSGGGSLCGGNRPARGWRDGFSGGLWVCLRKAGNGRAISPARVLYQDTRCVLLVLRHGLDVGIASGTCLGSGGMLRSVLVPLRRSPRLGDTGRSGGCAENTIRWAGTHSAAWIAGTIGARRSGRTH